MPTAADPVIVKPATGQASPAASAPAVATVARVVVVTVVPVVRAEIVPEADRAVTVKMVRPRITCPRSSSLTTEVRRKLQDERGPAARWGLFAIRAG